MGDIILGIDLGTTNSEVAIYENGTVTLVDGPEGKILPSCVGIDVNGDLLVGHQAMNQFVIYPENTVKSVKRLMGKADRIPMGDTHYSPQEISAMILRKLKNMAEDYKGETISKAVITVPAFFSDIQRQATREAGEIAGLEVVKMINEPTAATLVYENRHKEHKKVLVYDLGGGTFDVSVVQIEDDVIEVIASHGNNSLGGDDFDGFIENYLVERVTAETEIDTISRHAQARIRRAAENAKIYLSSHPFASIEEEYLLEQDSVPFHLRVELPRLEYEEMITPLVDETMDAVHLVIKDAGLTASDIDEILLVGGSTRTPLIQDRLEKEFGFPPRFEVDPDLCVAGGAALQAAMVAGNEVQAVLVDITPYTFGVSAIGEVGDVFSMNKFVPLIKKNTPVPVTRSEVFYTAVDYQEVVEVKVYQGEAEDALENTEVGQFFIEGLQKTRAGSEIIATFSLDTNGILQVRAKEKDTGLEKSITIENVLSQAGMDSLKNARGKISQLFGDTSDDISRMDVPQKATAVNTRKIQAEALIEKARGLFDTSNEDDQEDMITLIEAITNDLQNGENDTVQDSMDELAEIIFYLES